MKKNLLVFLILSVVFLISWEGKNEQMETVTPLNVVLINVDDLGWKDVGFMDGDYLETPNIDEFAQRGMRFTNAYASAANCAPSRAGLMTGEYGPRHGIYTVGSSARGKETTRKLIPIKNTDSLHQDVFTMADMFKKAGYKTGTFGKWHLGTNPLKQGFDVNVGGSLRGNPGKNGYFSPYNIDNLENGPTGEYLTDRLTSEAIQFLRDNQKNQFFLYLPFYSVHTPLMAKASLVKKYREKQNPKKIDPTYAAMVETMDANVGRLLKELEVLGLLENTIVIFTSDNGGIRSIAPQDPLRAGKGSYYEGGIRVPCIIRWPGVTEPGSWSNVPINNIDFFPTFKELLSIELPEKNLDGISLIPVLKKANIPERSLFWHFPIYLESYDPKNDEGRDPLFRTRPGSVILDGEWKLHWYYEDQDLELYHLATDIGERTNLAAKEKERTAEMLEKLQHWQREVNAPIPTEKNPFYISKNK